MANKAFVLMQFHHDLQHEEVAYFRLDGSVPRRMHVPSTVHYLYRFVVIKQLNLKRGLSILAKSASGHSSPNC